MSDKILFRVITLNMITFFFSGFAIGAAVIRWKYGL